MSREMKDSGVEWIGEIPKNWNVQRVKNAFVRKKAEAGISKTTCRGTLMDTFIETTMDSENQRISTQSIQLHTDYRTLGYNKQQAQACVKQYQKDYANIRGLTYQASVTDKEMKQLLVLKLTDIDTAQLKKLDFIQTLEDAVFDVHTAVVVYEQQGLTCSTKPAA